MQPSGGRGEGEATSGFGATEVAVMMGQRSVARGTTPFPSRDAVLQRKMRLFGNKKARLWLIVGCFGSGEVNLRKSKWRLTGCCRE